MRFPKRSIFVVAVAAASCRAPAADPLEVVVAPLDTSVTPDRWLAAHPGDSIGIRGEAWSWSPHRENCRTAITRGAQGSLRFRRIALFVVPRPPAGFAFDADTARLAERRCELQSVRIVFGAANHDVARHLADSLSQLVATRLGAPGQTPSQDPNIGARDFALAWDRADETTEVRVYADRSPPNNEIVGWRTTVEHFTHRADFEENPVAKAHALANIRAATPTWTFLDSLLAEAAIPETRQLTAELERLAPGGKTANPSRLDDVVLPAIRTLTTAIASLPPARRAAALLAADALVMSAAPVFISSRTTVANDPRLRAYKATGAVYEVEPPSTEEDMALAYTRNWLAAARRADSASFAGRAAFRQILSAAGQIAPGCLRNDQYRVVIEMGEPALRTRLVDSALAHRLLAEAYADVVSMAMGRDTGTVFQPQMVERYEGFPIVGTEADLRPIRAEMPEAQRRGFAHARAALALAKDSVDQAALWQLMFRSVAGIPGGITFACIGE